MENLIPALSKNQTHTVTISGYSSDGYGVCHIGGRAVFVKGALAGEKWEVIILKVSSSAVYAKAVTLLAASAERRIPQCENFDKCGGCDLLHMSYEEELRYKLSRVNGAIKHIGGLDFQVGGITGADTYEAYRNKAVYAVGGTASEPAIGFFRSRTHDVIPLTRCLIQSEESDALAHALRSWMKAHGIKPYSEANGKGNVRHLLVRRAFKTGETLACVVAARGFGGDTSSLSEALRAACPSLVGVVLCINKSRGNSILDGKFFTLWGKGSIEDELCSLKFEISPRSFYQINPPQAERLYEKAVEYASSGGDGTVLDLYCGVGTISLCIARRAQSVIGVEIVPEAIENARANAQVNGISNVEFIGGDAGDAAKELARRSCTPDAIVIDPPRKGLDASVIEAIVSMSPAHIVYVSCDPGTLARDMKIFASSGYLPVSGQAFDLFPRCAHVETVVLMSKVG